MRDQADPAARKTAQRSAALAKRDAMFAGLRARASKAACIHLMGVLDAVPATWPVAAFLASRSEIDSADAVRQLQRRGTPVGMPVVAARGKPLVFRRLRMGDTLESGVFGIPVPPAAAPEIVPSVYIVPLAAFDRRGYRIGYGGGFYDRTLEQARGSRRIVAIGFAFACQQVGEVVREAFDQRLDMIVTERGVLPTRS